MSTIHVAACCDENYAPYALVMMLSALRASQSSSLHFHFIDCGLSELSSQRMVSAIQAEGGQVAFYKPNSEAYNDLPTHRYGGAVYHRINLPDYLPSSLERVIYIDSDTLVVKDLQPLWSFDLEGKPLAAVENLSPFACRDLGVSRDSYFNSGVLVIDLDAWRREGLHHQVNRYAREHAHKLQYVDQCSLNAVFHGRWAKLPAIWNQQSDIFKTISKYQSGCGYTQLQSWIMLRMNRASFISPARRNLGLCFLFILTSSATVNLWQLHLGRTSQQRMKGYGQGYGTWYRLDGVTRLVNVRQK